MYHDSQKKDNTSETDYEILLLAILIVQKEIITIEKHFCTIIDTTDRYIP